jgi:hypothetical protein
MGSAPIEANDSAVDTAEMVEATALLGLDGHAEFLSAVPVRAKARRLRRAFTSPDYAFVARDTRGTAIARVPGILQYNTGHHSDEREPRVVLSAHVPANGTASIDVEFKGTSIGERRRSRSAPDVHVRSLDKALPISRAEAIDVRWTATDADKDPLEIRKFESSSLRDRTSHSGRFLSGRTGVTVEFRDTYYRRRTTAECELLQTTASTRPSKLSSPSS